MRGAWVIIWTLFEPNKDPGLEELVIEGYYAKHWPTYLEKRMGTRVKAVCSLYPEEQKLDEKAHNEDELKHGEELDKA